MNRESLIFMRVSQLQRQLLANSATVLQQVGITNAQYHHKDGKTGSDQKKTSR